MKQFAAIIIVALISFLIGFNNGKSHVIYKGISEIRPISDTQTEIVIDEQIHLYDN